MRARSRWDDFAIVLRRKRLGLLAPRLLRGLVQGGCRAGRRSVRAGGVLWREHGQLRSVAPQRAYAAFLRRWFSQPPRTITPPMTAPAIAFVHTRDQSIPSPTVSPDVVIVFCPSVTV